MPGQRPHRPLPYALEVVAGVTPERRLRIEMINRGSTGATFTVHDNSDAQEPWHYTIGAGDRSASEQWHDAGPLSAYDLTLRGPNGLWRRYAGSLDPQGSRAEVLLVQRGSEGAVELVLHNGTRDPAVFTIALDHHYPAQGARMRTVSVAPGKQATALWQLAASDHWYDFAVTLDGDAAFLRRFAGKIETGRAGRTDPGIGPMRVMA
jgi:phospholipase C